MGNRKPIFIDRDGVISADTSPYLSRVEQQILLPGAIQALIKLCDRGFDIFVVSNQQGVGRGITTHEELAKMEEAIQAPLKGCGHSIKKFYYCTALDSENHPWRKPSPGMILAAANEFGLDVKGAFLIGDKWSDIEAASKGGCRPLLVLSGVTGPNGWPNWEHQPEVVFRNLNQAVDWLLLSQ
jgi:D-glycero-D-manno-heptose 1,7-bisphosphate phosphatase